MTRLTLSVWLICLTLTFPFEGNASELSTAEAFFDSDPGLGMGVPVAVNPGSEVSFLDSISLGGLAPGRHTLYVRYRDNEGTWSAPMARRFGVMPPTGTGQDFISAGESFLDADPGAGNGASLAPEDGTFDGTEEEMTYLAAAAGLDTGLHVVYVRARDGCGLWSGLLAKSVRVVTPHAVAQADSGAERVRVGWTSYPEAIHYYVCFDSSLSGDFASFVTVTPPETSVWIPIGGGRSRFYKVRAVLPDPSPVAPSSSAYPRLEGERP